VSRQVIEIRPSDRVINFANGSSLELSGFAGRATHFAGLAPGLRSAELPGDVDTAPGFEAALNEIGAYEQETIHLDAAPAAGLRASQPDRIVLRPAVGGEPDAAARVVLYQDESGGLSWHFAAPAAKPRLRGLRMPAQSSPVFVIPARTVAARGAIRAGGGSPAKVRGIFTKFGRKIFKVIVMPVAAALLESPVQSIVGAIERRHRADRIWEPTPSTYASGPTGDAVDWGRFAGKRSLLLVHGIFSTVEGMLSALPRPAMEELYAGYDGRVLAYNHISVAKSPEENARLFLEEAKRNAPSADFQFDILCHSRGGIVSRALAEHGMSLYPGSNCHFEKVFFVATPNNGSPLGDAAHMVDMVDVFTNLLTAFPDGPIMYSIEVLLAIVKLLAYAAEKSLPGIEAMGTDGYIQQVLNRSNQPSPARYAAACADYRPDPETDNGFFTGRFATGVIGRIFEEDGREVGNDLVVPERGVYAANGHPSFPIAAVQSFAAGDHVWHSGFFRRQETVAAIRRHFEMGRPVSTSGEGRTPSLTGQQQQGGWLPDELLPWTGEGERPRRRGGLRGALGLRSGFEPPPPLGEPAMKPTAAKSQEPFQAERKPAIDFPPKLVAAEERELTVRLEEIATGAAAPGRLVLDFAGGEEEIALDVVLDAPGFDVIGANHGRMRIRRRRDAAGETASFRLKAADPGKRAKTRRITAEFWQGNNRVGEVVHATTVLPAGREGSARPKPPAPAGTLQVSVLPRQDCDLAIIVRNAASPYQLSLRSRVEGEEYEGKDVGELRLDGADFFSWINQLVDDKFATYPQNEARIDSWNADFIGGLRDFGAGLWAMLPGEFRGEYLRLREKIRSIAVYSTELMFPWELVLPSGMIPSGEGRTEFRKFDFLGAAHVLGRWRLGLNLRPKRQRPDIVHFVITRPRYVADDLDWADAEVKALRDLIRCAQQLPTVRKVDMEALLDRNDVQMIHFTGHGDYQANADLNALRLENGEKLTAIALLSTRLGMEAAPVLYLNACSVGKAAPSPGRMGGFTANCLAGGWGGVIAPYWLINDESAASFSASLYTKLLANRSIGEALQELRAERPGDPTFLAYSYIGDPWVRPVFV
jgi:CHAT domain